MLARLLESLSRLFRRGSPSGEWPDLRGIDRYWRAANGGDPYLDLYQDSRRLTESSDSLFKQNRFYTLMQMVDHVLEGGIEGDIAECGCWRGHSTLMMARRLRDAAWPGRMFVLDSFEGGLSDKVAQDRSALGDTSPGRTRELKMLFASSMDAVTELMRPFGFVSLHRGWIPAVFGTVPTLDARRYALVHVDVDLYEPTRDSLDFFGPRMAPGGVIVIDDYGSANFPGAKVAVDEFRARHRPRFFIESHLMGAVMLM